jgi:ribosomal protein L37AE/L43A
MKTEYYCPKCKKFYKETKFDVEEGICKECQKNALNGSVSEDNSSTGKSATQRVKSDCRGYSVRLMGY